MIQVAEQNTAIWAERASELGDARRLLDRLEVGPLTQDDLEKLFRLLKKARWVGSLKSEA
jgi:hypothetical protein